MTINGETHDLDVPANWTLLHLLRDHLSLNGTKDACRQGTCGSCTVLIDGVPRRACLELAVRCDNAEIRTVEGLEVDGKLHPLQQAFIDEGAVQCGFCTAGMLMTATAFLDETPQPTEHQVREALVGNLCRCTGYTRIVRAVMTAAKQPGPSAEPGA
jgi:carbon-monoxide dehydrogenase small subunit